MLPSATGATALSRPSGLASATLLQIPRAEALPRSLLPSSLSLAADERRRPPPDFRLRRRRRVRRKHPDWRSAGFGRIMMAGQRKAGPERALGRPAHRSMGSRHPYRSTWGAGPPNPPPAGPELAGPGSTHPPAAWPEAGGGAGRLRRKANPALGATPPNPDRRKPRLHWPTPPRGHPLCRFPRAPSWGFVPLLLTFLPRLATIPPC